MQYSEHQTTTTASKPRASHMNNLGNRSTSSQNIKSNKNKNLNCNSN